MTDRKQYLKEYYTKNRDKMRNQRKEYHIKNREHINEKANEYYEQHKLEMIAKAATRTRSYRTRNMEYVDSYLSSHPCVDCGYSNIIALEFDHVRDQKKCCVMDIVHAGNSIELLQEEINKCEVRCANCHKIVTYKRWIESKE